MPANETNLKILVVEDNHLFRSLAIEMLTGYETFQADTASEGLKLYKEHKPDIVFLDIGLPDKSGHEVLKEIMKLNKKAFIVMLTASSLQADVEDSMSNGAESYIIKPFSRRKIKESIEKYHNRK